MTSPTPATMTREERAELAAKHAAATEGPWSFRQCGASGDCGFSAPRTGIFAEFFADIRRSGENARDEALANAEFAEAAHRDVPRLLASLTAAEERAEVVEREIAEHHPREMAGINRDYIDAIKACEAAEAQRDKLAAALRRLSQTSVLLLQNAEGCAVNHYGEDFAIHGAPGWLADCQRDVDAARAALANLHSEPVAEARNDPSLIFHASRSPDACDHDFKGWRETDGGRGGEQVCTKCGMGAMEHTLKRGF